MKKLAYISLILALFSCTKFGKNVTIKGRAINPATGEGIAGVTFSLQKGTLGWNGGYKTIKTAISDENGNFELSALSVTAEQIMANPGNRYGVGWFEQGSDKQIGGNYTMQIKIGKTLHADYQAVPYGQLSIHIKNNSCFDSNDNIKIYFDGEDYNSRTFNPGIYTELNGCIDITDNPIKSAMGNKFFHWVVTKNNVSTTYYDTVFVGEEGVTVFNMFY